MKNMKRNLAAALLATTAFVVFAGCSKSTAVPAPKVSAGVTAPTGAVTAPVTTPPPAESHGSQTDSSPVTTPAPPPAGAGNTTAPVFKTTGELVSDPASMTVLVNKRFRLPADYRPADLVEPKVAFIFAEKHDKRLMRKEAAEALELMFAAAKKDGIALAGVSGFRSYETQKALFSYYVQTQGEETARRYSAEPGHSEHQTGLTMDISGSTGACAADDCFADTPEATWLAAHAPEYGFIIRYPKGKESITGYAYEPWHVRYVGTTMSKAIAARGQTMEEHLGKAQ